MQNNLKVEFEPITDEMVDQILKNHDQVLTVTDRRNGATDVRRNGATNR